jgi:chromosome segregation ATPase
MTMQDPQERRAGPGAVNWLHDQVGQLKTQLGRLQQQNDQLQALVLDLGEKLRSAEGDMRELSAKAIALPTMHEQLRQLAGVLDRIQDAEVLIDTKFELLERQEGERNQRGQAEKNDLFKRMQDLERRVEGWGERQSGVEDAGRRFQEEVSRTHIQFQGVTQRLEQLESRAARAIDAIARLEQSHGEDEAAIRGLRREDDVLAERARLGQDIATRLEVELRTHEEEFRTLPLLAERVELLRAERQRLEDRASRLEETLADATQRLERQEELTGQQDKRLQAHDSRMDHVHTSTLDYRRMLSDQQLKLSQMLERMKRREVEELEREVKELRAHGAMLKTDEE